MLQPQGLGWDRRILEHERPLLKRTDLKLGYFKFSTYIPSATSSHHLLFSVYIYLFSGMESTVDEQKRHTGAGSIKTALFSEYLESNL